MMELQSSAMEGMEPSVVSVMLKWNFPSTTTASRGDHKGLTPESRVFQAVTEFCFSVSEFKK